jgi:hypothetical protein
MLTHFWNCVFDDLKKVQKSTYLSYIFCSPAGSLYNHVASVSRARFVTAGAIDPKFCTYVQLEKSNSQTKFWSSLILGLATRGPKPKTNKCYNHDSSWTNCWINFKFLSWVYLIRIHDIIPRFLIWPTFEGHRGQSSKRHSCWHVSLLFDIEHSILVSTCI